MNKLKGTSQQNETRTFADGSGTKEPVTARGVRTRATLVAAARVVFERDGFLGSRITDIAAEAGCASGTFYIYFSSKEEALIAVLEAAQDDMLHPGLPHVPETDDPTEVIAASNRAYLTAYLRNARLMEILYQVASIDPMFQDLRRRRSAAFNERSSRHIAELQARGLADPTLDPLNAGKALSGMVSRVAMELMVQEGTSLDETVELVTKLWINALKLRAPEDSKAASWRAGGRGRR
ncbi:MAG: TetR/AcrR family transcriptional regulator [Solirubrobacterales bacterium]